MELVSKTCTYASQKGTKNMLLIAKVLLWFGIILEFLFAQIPISGSEDTLSPTIEIDWIGILLLIHCVALIFVSSLASRKQIIFVLISGILLLSANLINDMYISPLAGSLYISAGIIATFCNQKKDKTNSDL